LFASSEEGTIPADFRRRLGITDDSLLQVSEQKGEIRIRPVRVTSSDWLRQVYDLLEPVRKEASHHSEAEVNAAIDAAVSAVRRNHE
jgi:hypothetical protein